MIFRSKIREINPRNPKTHIRICYVYAYFRKPESGFSDVTVAVVGMSAEASFLGSKLRFFFFFGFMCHSKAGVHSHLCNSCIFQRCLQVSATLRCKDALKPCRNRPVRTEAKHARAHTRIHARNLVHKCAHVCTHTHACTHTCTHVCTRVHAYECTHVHMRARRTDDILALSDFVLDLAHLHTHGLNRHDRAYDHSP